MGTEAKAYWWCPRCKLEVDGRSVTYEEYHQNCGTRVESVQPGDPLDMLRKEIERLREANESVAVCRDHVAQITSGGCLVCEAEDAHAEIERLRDALRGIDDATCFAYETMPEVCRADAHEIVRVVVRNALAQSAEKVPVTEGNGGVCDDCGHFTIDRCPRCGAPQCCPRCCAEDHELALAQSAPAEREG